MDISPIGPVAAQSLAPTSLVENIADDESSVIVQTYGSITTLSNMPILPSYGLPVSPAVAAVEPAGAAQLGYRIDVRV